MNCSERKRAILWLQAVVGLTSYKINLIDEVLDPISLMLNPVVEIEKLRGKITRAEARNILKPFERKQIDDILFLLDQKGFGVIIRGEPEYPERLNEIDVPPAILYYKGDIGLLKTNCLAVVGTREPSRYGRDYTERFVDELSKYPLTIVSGMARGIDSVAHRTTLNNGGKTIAVLGCGIDIVYPANNAQLYDDIALYGLIISEYTLGTPSLPFNFPERNRIISGISHGVLIPEAGLKSGSLITAENAIKQNRELFIIPSALNSPRGQGGNLLLKTCQAAMVLSPDDVVSALGIRKIDDTTSNNVLQLSFIEEKLISALSYSEIHFDDLIELTGLSVSDLNVLLVKMEIMGLIKKLDNNYYGV